MNIHPLDIPGAYLIDLEARSDERGYFVRKYDRQFYASHGMTVDWVQENQSLSLQPYTIRGLHFQRPPFTETKLVSVVRGRLFDVMVDLRSNSPCFGEWIGVELSAETQQMLYVPKGCAHGFCTLEPNTMIQYKVDSVYAPEYESGLFYADSDVGIEWPIPDDATITVSKKDASAASWSQFESPFDDERMTIDVDKR